MREEIIDSCISLRQNLGLANPNHAAAMICALLPLCWEWRRCAWLGRIAFVALCVMLALTQSRTGFVLMAIEAIAELRIFRFFTIDTN